MTHGKNTMSRTRVGVVTAKLAVVGAVLAVGLLVGGAVLAISLAAGASVAVFEGRKGGSSCPDGS
jgi:hypothetical protein